MKRVLQLSLLVLLLISPILLPIVHLRASSLDVDPSPLLVLLNDIFSSLSSGNYSEAKRLLNLMGNTSLPLDIEADHKRLYSLLRKLVVTLNEIENIERKQVDQNAVRHIYLEVYKIRLNLRKYLDDYLASLRVYIQDHALWFLLVKGLKKRLNILETMLDELLSRLEEYYRRLIVDQERGIITVDVDLRAPRTIYAAKGIPLSIFVNCSNTSLSSKEPLNMFLTIIYGGLYYVREKIQVICNETKRITLPAARIEDLYRSGVLVYKDVVSLRIVGRIESYVNGSLVVGSNSVSAFIRYQTPNVFFIVPPYVYINNPFYINITGRIDRPINLTIYLDSILPENVILNTTLNVTPTLLKLELSNTSTGYHVLIFKIGGKGYYIPRVTSSAIVVLRHTASVVLKVPNIVTGPPFIIPIRGKLLEPNVTEYLVTISTRHNVLYSSKLSNKTFYILVNLPFTPFIWVSDVNVTLHPLRKGYDPTIFTYSVSIVNLFTLIILALITSVAITTPPAFRYIRKTLNLLIALLVVGQERGGVLRIPVEKKTAEFRKFRLVKIYKKFLAIISPLIGLPRSSETLREYSIRASKRLSHVQDSIKELIYLFEKDLYSLHPVNKNAAIKLLKDIAKRVKTLVS